MNPEKFEKYVSKITNYILKHETFDFKEIINDLEISKDCNLFFQILEECNNQYLNKDERHQLGAHYTHEIDIKKIVQPVIVEQWTQKIDNAKTLYQYYELLNQLRDFKVLDPSCGSGNFLFVAYKEMKIIENTLLKLIRLNSIKPIDIKRLEIFLQSNNFVSTQQFYGYDIKPFSVELAKFSLLIAQILFTENQYFELKNNFLEKNIICCDALLDENSNPRKWIEVDAIIGNPPFQSKTKMQYEFGREYVSKLRKVYPQISGHADFCVYWFYNAHKYLKQDGFAGLIGTNTITQNFSREGGLDYIVNNGGTIFNAISSQVWAGSAMVYIAIVNWKKGNYEGIKRLYYPNELKELKLHEINHITSNLSYKTDIKSAKTLQANIKPKSCFQGHTHGYSGFLLTIDEAKKLIEKKAENKKIIKPFLIGNELVGNYNSQPKRFIIDFSEFTDISEIQKYKDIYQIIEKKVFNEVKIKAEKEFEQIKKNGTRQNHLKHWWHFWAVRQELINTMKNKQMYIACARVTMRPIFEFISTQIIPNDKIIVFPFEDYYSFAIIQSNLHWEWLKLQSTTLGTGYNYNLPIWETFPFPQNPKIEIITKISEFSKLFLKERNNLIKNEKLTLREIYRILELPGNSKLSELKKKLETLILTAYDFDSKKDILEQLLNLNLELAEKEKNNIPIQKPGIPDYYENKVELISDDCVKFIGDGK